MINLYNKAGVLAEVTRLKSQMQHAEGLIDSALLGFDLLQDVGVN